MAKSIRFALVSVRDLLASAAPFVAIAAGMLWCAYWWLDPTPPTRITLATGPSQSAYAEFGERYAKKLAESGIEVVLLPSEGSSANLQLLKEGRADVGFVQGGSARPLHAAQDDAPEILSLGDLFVEPIWLFYREDAAKKKYPHATLNALADLRGLRLNVGTPGSGVPLLMNTLLEINRIEPHEIQISQLDQTPATVGLLEGQLDAIVFASAPESLMVQMLLQTPGIKLLDFAQNEAYARRISFLSPVVLPNGVVDLAGNLPSQDVRLIATTTGLLAREETHPALLQLFSQASLELHSSAGWFNRANEFPKATSGEFALAAEAQRTLRNGIPVLQRYLSFSWANLVERMWLAMGIILAVVLPLSKIAPPLYTFRIRSRVFRWYGALRDLEDRLEAGGVASAELLEQLNDMDAQVSKVVVPLSYADELYALRNYIDQVRQKLLKS